MTVYKGGVKQNPWKLAPCEARSMDAMIEHGDFKTAARELGIGHETIKTQIFKAGAKMGQPGRLKKYVMWDRWRRNE